MHYHCEYKQRLSNTNNNNKQEKNRGIQHLILKLIKVFDSYRGQIITFPGVDNLESIIQRNFSQNYEDFRI